MNHLAIARASCEGREGTHPALRPNGSGLMAITILASDGGSNPTCGTRRFMNLQKLYEDEKRKSFTGHPGGQRAGGPNHRRAMAGARTTGHPLPHGERQPHGGRHRGV